MKPPVGRPGPVRTALVFACVAAGFAHAATLEITDDTDATVASVPLPLDGRWCLVWNHSVTGEEVRDCFRADGAALILERSHQIDFSSAGLGHIPGRGTIVPDPAGGQWIEGIEETVRGGALPLRVGASPVDHRVVAAGAVTSLSALAAGRRVTIRPDAAR